METYSKCLNCMIDQGSRLACMITEDIKKRAAIHKAVDEYVNNLCKEDMRHSPAELSTPVYFLLRELTGVIDPFKNQKDVQNKNALNLYSEMMEYVDSASDPLHVAAKISTLGNVIDSGITTNITEFGEQLAHAIKEPFAIDDFEIFRNKLEQAKTFLLIADNAGEVVFDKCLLETIHKYYPQTELFVSVKEAPILNDATIDDALLVGLDKFAKIVTTGSDYIGAPLKYVGKDFIELMKKTDLILAKGQGNYETLEKAPGRFFLSLKAKCEVIAEHIGVQKDAILFKKSIGKESFFDVED